MSKRRRLNGTVDHDLAKTYDDLANENEETRIKAAESLLSRFSLTSNSGEVELCSVLKRLFRGLCSGRKSARLGYSVTLTEFLSSHAVVSSTEKLESPLHLSNVLRALGEQTQISGKASGPEERDRFFGRVFGAEAVIKSKTLFTPSADISHWDHLLGLIIEVIKKKAWLSEECGWILYEALQTLNEHPSGVIFAQRLIDALADNDFLRTPEGVAVWVAAEENFKGIKFPRHVYHHRDPLNRKERKVLAGILKETGSSVVQEDKGQASQKGNLVPRLHVAWEIVFTAIDKDNPNRVRFSELWKEAVDGMTLADGLFATSSSVTRKYWGFHLFQKYIGSVSVENLHYLLTKNFLRCLVNQLASKERQLHGMAQRCQVALLARAKNSASAILPMLTALLRTSGYLQVDLSIKSKMVEKLLKNSDAAALPGIVSLLKDMIIDPHTKDEKGAAHIRQIAADYLLTIVKLLLLPEQQNSTSQQSKDVIEIVLETLSSCAYFKHTLAQGKPPLTAISSRSHEMLKSRITSCLTLVIDKETTACHHPYQLAMALAQKENEIQQRAGPRKGLRESVSQATKLLTEVHDARVTAIHDSGIYQAFELFVSLTIVQVYNGDDDAMSLLEELEQCYRSVRSNESDTKSRTAVEAMVEIILTSVSKPSLLFRRVAQQVFPTLASSLDRNSIDSMIRVLEAPENANGQSELFDQADEKDDADTMDIDASDVEEIDAGSATPQEEDAASEDSEPEPSVTDGDDNEDDNEKAAAFEAKLAQALGTRRADEDVNGHGDESADEDMDDAQMEQLDTQISAIFKERKNLGNNKKENKDARRMVTLFKCRVIELLEIFVKKIPNSSLGLDLIHPLLSLIKITSSKDAASKASGLIREYLKAYKLDLDPANEDIAVLETAQNQLVEVHNLAGQEGSNMYRNACSQASLLLAKIMLTNGGNIKNVWQTYADTGAKFVTDPTCNIKNQFFTDWLNWCVSVKQAYEKADKPH